MHQDRWSRAGARPSDGVPADRRREADRHVVGARVAEALAREARWPEGHIRNRCFEAHELARMWGVVCP